MDFGQHLRDFGSVLKVFRPFYKDFTSGFKDFTTDFKVFKTDFSDFWLDFTDYRNCRHFRLDFRDFGSDFRTFVHRILEVVRPSKVDVAVDASLPVRLSTLYNRVSALCLAPLDRSRASCRLLGAGWARKA